MSIKSIAENNIMINRSKSIMEVKHITARFAWHDSGWNGKICKSPSDNVYCRENYSLLSSRIQRRIDLSREEKYKEKSVCEIFTNENYTPPCYWCINAFGEKDCTVLDPHPFSDLEWMKELFKDVPPLEVELLSNTIYTWCFKLSFAEEGSPEGRYPADLEERAEKYISKIVPNRSVVFFYANYSNPVTGDDYKRLLLGCAVVEKVLPPKKFRIPPEILKKVKSGRGMQNFSEIAWQFGVKIKPETAFVLPYHKYLSWIENARNDEEKDRRLKLLREITVAIDESTLQPLFKYVSMQLSTDQAIYLMYLLKRAVKKMKEHGLHGLVPRSVIDNILEKIDRILRKLWKERGKYPGFRSAVATLLRHSFAESKEVANKIGETVLKTCGDVSSYLDGKKEPKTDDVRLERAISILNRKRDLLKFLSLFDLSPKQMERVLEIIENIGLNTIKNNPYRILEEYNFEVVEHWDWDESDTGIDLYHIDIAILPDPEFAGWYFEEFDPKSPYRIRAIVSKLLLKAVLNEGDTYLTRSEILEKIREYPLYYVGGELKIGEAEFEHFERDPLFKEKFVINEDPKTGERIYQLSSIREIESKIEEFIKTMLKKTYRLTHQDESFILQAVRNECAIAVQRGILSEREKGRMKKERENLYRTSLSRGFTVISGGAGTGKTQAIANLVKHFRETAKGRIFVLSPTGKSNIVIRKRLREIGLNPDSDGLLKVSTIHRLLYGGLIEAIEEAGMSIGKYYKEIRTLNNLISDLLEGKFGRLRELWNLTKRWKFSPYVVIIDEASMVDELTLAALLSLFDEQSLKHLILVGDEKQLPPIGVGRPFSDIIFFLKHNGLEENIIYLRTNLRFPENSSLNILSSIFASDEAPAINEIIRYCSHSDNTLELRTFSDSEDLKRILKEIITEIVEAENLDVAHKEDLFEFLKSTFDEKGVDIIQILAPTRAGELGTWVINNKLIVENRTTTLPGSKLICEENIYIDVERNGRKRRVLGLANGSMLYLREGNRIESEEIKEIFRNYGKKGGWDLINKIRNDIFDPLSVDKRISLAYAITVHKSQGSDFDYVILILNEITSFITRELIYTALTRAKKKLYLIVHDHLAQELSIVFWKIHQNSVNEKLKTTLFTTKRSIFKPYILTLRNGEKVFLRSKIEYMIAKILDELGIQFKYEPGDFLEKGIKPDFKIVVDGNVYYWEHLGLLDKVSYRERWLMKLEVYRELGYEDNLITTTESEKPSEIEEKIRKIVEDLKSGNLQTTESGYPSRHHYEL